MASGQGMGGHAVGRVGALAVALGIGGVILGLPAVAVADRGEAADTGAAATTDTTPAPATRPSRGAHRQSRADAPTLTRAERGSASPAAPAAAARWTGHGPQPVTAKPAAEVSVPEPAAPQPSPVVVSAVADSYSSPPAVSDNRAAPVAAAVTSSPVVLPTSVTQVMTSAAPRGALSAAGAHLLAWLGGGSDPSAPIATPLGWAALAATRREFSGAARTAAPSASVAAAAVASGPLSEPGVITALVGAGKQLILAVAAGGSAGPALKSALASLDSDPALVNISLESVLTDPALPRSMGTTAQALVTGLAADPAVRSAVGQALGDSIAAALGRTAVAQTIGTTLGGALVGLLADPAAANALGAVANTFVSVALAQPGLSAVATDVARQLFTGLGGADPSAALNDAWSALQAAPAFQSGLGPAVAAAVNVALTDPGLVSALGTATSSVVGLLPSVPGAATAFNALLGTTYGPMVFGMLADPATADQVAALAGSLVAGFVAEPGVADALSAAASQIATAALSGNGLVKTLLGTVKALQSTPAITAALDATISTAVHSVLGDPTMQGPVVELARGIIVGYVAGFAGKIPLIGGVAVKVTSAAVDTLLANPTFQDLIGTVAEGFAGGVSTTDLAQSVIAAVVEDHALQVAVAQAVGQGVGALFGNNPIGALVGKVAGAAATAVIGFLCSIGGMFVGVQSASPAAAVGTSKSGYSYLLTV